LALSLGFVAVGRDAVVEIVFRRRKIPHRHDHIALDALRPLRLREGQLAACDAVGSVGIVLQRGVDAHVTESERHLRQGLSDCVRRAQPATPGPNSFGTVRMPLLPSEWHDWQAFFTVSTHCSCVLMLALMPLPFSPVPGNSPFAES